MSITVYIFIFEPLHRFRKNAIISKTSTEKHQGKQVLKLSLYYSLLLLFKIKFSSSIPDHCHYSIHRLYHLLLQFIGILKHKDKKQSLPTRVKYSRLFVIASYVILLSV